MSFTLFYDGGFVGLRSPELGDVRRLNTYVENRETIGGELTSVKDIAWPNKQLRSFVFRALTLTQANAFRDAIVASAGQQISIVDHNDEIWVGVIVSNPNEIITQRDTCSYDISFEMICEFSGYPVILENDDNDTVYNDSEVTVKVI